MLAEFLATEAYSYLLAFARLGTIIMVLPFFAQGYLPTRVRLMFAIGFTVALAPLIFPYLPGLPDNFVALTGLIVSEIIIGLFIGLIIYLFTHSLLWAGNFIAISAGLSNAVLFNPAQGEQSVIPAIFLYLAGLTFLFATDLDHLIYLGMMESYLMLPPATSLPFDDFAAAFARGVANSFLLGFQIAMPFIILGLVFNIMMGVVSRLMPQFQVFFVLLPLQLLASLLLLLVIFPTIMNTIAAALQNGLYAFFSIS